MRLSVVIITCILLSHTIPHAQGQNTRRPNILFIAADDLRPQLGCYGETYMHTPHLDQLAKTGRLFHRHYVQVPTCGASRFAMLTSQRPDLYANWNNGAFSKLKRKKTADPQTFAEFFRRNKYKTICIGKISHQCDGRMFNYDGKGSGEPEVPFAWDEVGAPYGKWGYGWSAFFGYANGLNRANWKDSTPVEAGNVDDEGYVDGLIANAAVAKINELAKTKQPFLLAVGFYKPHLPFVAPKKYWDLYDRDKIPLSPNGEKPTDICKNSWHNSAECFGARYHSGQWPRNEKTARLLRHGYFAAVSYVDAQIGKVLAALKETGLDDNTIVIVWGDHGWHLGDHAIWGKHSNFERSARSTLIIRAPNMPMPGLPTDALVETVDLYATLVDVTGLPMPKGLAGKSLKPILQNPKHPGKEAAFTYWRGGTSMRTDRYRLVIYGKGKENCIELYDHQTDPNETRNIAKSHANIVAELRPLLERNAPTMMKR